MCKNVLSPENKHVEIAISNALIIQKMAPKHVAYPILNFDKTYFKSVLNIEYMCKCGTHITALLERTQFPKFQ